MPLSSVVTTLRFTDQPTGSTATLDLVDKHIITPVGHTVTSADLFRWVYLQGVPGISLFWSFITSVDTGANTWTMADPATTATGGSNVGPYTLAGTSPFLSNVGLFNWLSSDGNDFANASDPGCLQFLNSGTKSFTSSVNGTAQSAQFAGMSESILNWEVLGVPAGKHVVYVTARIRHKRVDATNLDTSTANFQLQMFDEATQGIDAGLNLQVNPGDFSSSWTTKTQGKLCVPQSISLSSTPLFMSISVNAGTATAGVAYSTDYRFDTFELTIFYDDNWCDYCTHVTISPSSVTLITGQSQPFTTNVGATFAITEVGGGTLINVTSTSVTYVAPSTPGTYHLVATNACRADGDFSTATIQVIAGNDIYFQAQPAREGNGFDESCISYGAITGFLLTNPISAGHYILEANLNGAENIFAGENVRIRIFRDGGNALDTSDDPCTLLKAIMEYNVV